MKILQKEFGFVMTNCYILQDNFTELIIDPGENSYDWVKRNCKNPLAILNTHGHCDHIYDNFLLQKDGLKVYMHEDDEFMALNDFFGLLKNPCKPDVLVKDGDEFKFGNFNVKFHHFPGHTPGCCMIEVNGVMFSGDFLFKGSVGRYDFPFSNQADMKKSLLKALEIKKDFILYPGHGQSTTMDKERATIMYFLSQMD